LPNVAFGPAVSETKSYTDGYVKTTSMGTIAARRVAANGAGPQIITHVLGYVNGKGASRTITMYLGSSSATFTRAAASSGTSTGYVDTSNWYIANGDSSVEFGYQCSAAFYFSRGATGTRVTPYGSATGALTCSYTYIQAPAAPTAIAAITAADGVAKISWTAGDNGGSTITGYDVQYSINSNFTSSKTVSTAGAETNISIPELESNARYYFRVYAKNAVTTAAKTTSVASASIFFDVPKYGSQRYDDPTVYVADAGTFWSLGGHVVGFDKTGTQIEPIVSKQTFDYVSTVDGKPAQTNVDVRFKAPRATNFTNGDGNLFAYGVEGEEILVGSIGSYFNGNNSSVNRIAYKTAFIDYNAIDTLSWVARSGNDLYNQEFIISNRPSGETRLIRLETKIGNGTGSTVDTMIEQELFVGPNHPNFYEELAIFVFYSFNKTGQGNITVKVCNTVDYSNAITLSQNYSYYGGQIPLWNDNITIIGTARSLYMRNGGVIDAQNPNNVGFHNAPNYTIAEYESPPTYNSLVTNTDFPPVHSITGNMWNYLQDSCIATREEVALVDDVITLRNIGIRNIDADDFIEPPSITIDSTLTGKQVNVNYRESTYVASGEIYSAREDDNKVLSVTFGESIETTIQTDSSIISLNQPLPYYRTKGVPVPTGVYEIMDATKLPVKETMWLNYGGKLTVSKNPDIAGALNVFLQGPKYLIPSTTAPYSIAVSDGQNDYASLSVTGSGIKGKTNVLNLLTAADQVKTVQDVATTIVNPFITNLTQAYDVGSTASFIAAGTNLSLSGSVSTKNTSSFGIVEGSLIEYKNNIYRINRATVSNLVVSFEATAYVTVDAFQSKWNVDSTVDAYDYVWSGYQASDENVTPLTTNANSNVLVSVFGDTDSNPYFKNSSDTGYSVLFDTDGVPYYDTNYYPDQTVLLYLDIDGSPYYKA